MLIAPIKRMVTQLLGQIQAPETLKFAGGGAK
jgi:hypothetical protein